MSLLDEYYQHWSEEVEAGKQSPLREAEVMALELFMRWVRGRLTTSTLEVLEDLPDMDLAVLTMSVGVYYADLDQTGAKREFTDRLEEISGALEAEYERRELNDLDYLDEERGPEKQFIVVAGNVSEGLTFTGTFPTDAYASEWAEDQLDGYVDHWHVAKLEPVTIDDRHYYGEGHDR